MFCPECGEQVSDESDFCKHCGFKLIILRKTSVVDEIRNVIIRRLDGIKKKDARTIRNLVFEDKYSKFDDWPPFSLQHKEGLKNEEKALKIIQGYYYETRSWEFEVFTDSALATFIIRYKGNMKGYSFNIQSRVTTFLMCHEGKWKIIHEHWSRFPENIDKDSDNSKPIIL